MWSEGLEEEDVGGIDRVDRGIRYGDALAAWSSSSSASRSPGVPLMRLSSSSASLVVQSRSETLSFAVITCLRTDSKLSRPRNCALYLESSDSRLGAEMWTKISGGLLMLGLHLVKGVTDL